MSPQSPLGDYGVDVLPLHREFQDRPERDRMDEWYRRPSGICLLVGGYGAGKSVLAGKFLTTIRGGHKRESSTDPSYRAQFVFSFEHNRSADMCFCELLTWLGYTPSEQAANRAAEVIAALANEKRKILICLDAIEKAADREVSEGGGLVADLSCQLLQRVLTPAVRPTERHYDSVVWLITSQIAPTELRFQASWRQSFAKIPDSAATRGFFEAGASPNYHPIHVDQLSQEACLGIFRSFTLQGDRGALDNLAKQCGLHAFTVVLAASYIREYCGGDVADADVRTPPIEPPSGAQDDRDRYHTEIAKLNREIVQSYRKKLKADDPRALAVLDRFAFLRGSASADLFREIFCNSGSKELVGLSRDDIQHVFEGLAKRHLVSAVDNGEWAEHAGLRATILSILGNRRDDHRRIAAILEARLYESNLWDSLRLREELIYHLIQGNLISEAAEHLIELHRAVGESDWSLLTRAAASFFSKSSPATAKLPTELSSAQVARVLCTWCCGLAATGRWREARRGFMRTIEIAASALHSQEVLDCAFVAHTEIVWDAQMSGDLADADTWNQLRMRFLHSRRRKWKTEAYEARMENCIQTQSRIDMQLGRLGKGGTDQDDRTWIEGVRWLGATVDFQEMLNHHLASIQIVPPVSTGGLLWLDLAVGFAKGGEFSVADNLVGMVETVSTAKTPIEECVHCVRVVDIDLTRLFAKCNEYPVAERDSLLNKCLAMLTDGLDLAREYGYGLHHIDLLALRARAHLIHGAFEMARDSAQTALFGQEQPQAGDSLYACRPRTEAADRAQRGIFPPKDSGLPRLLAATHPECGYALGEVAAREVLAEAFMAMAELNFGPVYETLTPSGRRSWRAELLKEAKLEFLRLEPILQRMHAEVPSAIEPKSRLERVQKGLAAIDNGQTDLHPLLLDGIERKRQQAKDESFQRLLYTHHRVSGSSADSFSAPSPSEPVTPEQVWPKKGVNSEDYKAYASYIWAMDRTKTKSPGPNFELVKVNRYYEYVYGDDKPPSPETWERYVRRADQRLNEKRGGLAPEC